MDPDGRLVSWVMDHLDDITAHRLKQIGVATFFYAGLRVAEGIGLVLEKVWAEYLTVGMTAAFLPWELYEIVRRLDWLRVGLLVVESAGARVSDLVAAAQSNGEDCGAMKGLIRAS